MDDLPKSARTFLEAIRRADDPTPAQRARSDEALRATLAKHGIEGLSLLANGPAQHVGARLGSRGLFAAKLGVGVLTVVAASYLGVRSLSPHPAERPPPQPAAAKAPPLAPAAPPLDAIRAQPSTEPRTVEVARETESRAPVQALRRSETRRTPQVTRGSLEGELRTVAAVDALVRQQRWSDALRMLERTESAAAAVLREERSALRILARCGIEPSAPARRERDQFLRDSPRSVLAERVRDACANKDSEGP